MVAIGIWLMLKVISDRAMVITLLKIGVSAGAMVVAVFSVRALGVAAVPTAAVAVSTYIAFALVTRTVTAGDVLFLVNTVRRKLKPSESAKVR